VSSGVRTAAELTDDEVGAVLALVDQAAVADGASALSEQSRLAVRHGAARTHLLAEDSGPVVGYALVEDNNDNNDDGGGSERTAELVVAPAARGHGFGDALATVLLADPGPLTVWAHGDHPGAAVLAATHGLSRTRTLFQLRRALDSPVPAPELPPGVHIRPFVVGQDEQDWVRVNARAFAHHPEQGRWQLADVTDREAEPWFDPAGFLLAVRDTDDALLGFHWTKVHSAEELHEDGPAGEVYVVGVDPELGRGMHLGQALTRAGLVFLQERGLHSVLLYVDDDNPRAVDLYRQLGFTEHTIDVTYTRSH